MNTTRLAKQIGRKVASLRQKSGFGLDEFATKHGFSKGYLSDIENGKRIPTIQRLAQIAQAFRVRLKDFF